jgi:hypothetical protein
MFSLLRLVLDRPYMRQFLRASLKLQFL